MGFQLYPGLADDCAAAGHVRDSVRYLAGNGWLEIGTLGGRTSITLGVRARKLLEKASAGVT